MIYKIIAASNEYQRLVADDDALWTRLRFDCRPQTDWQPPKVRIFDPAKTAGDFLSFASGSLTIRGEKLEFVRTSFEMAGEVLKLDGQNATYWCLNVLVCINCLDEDASEWLVDAKSGRRITLKRPVFRRGFLAESSIFKIPQQPGSLYVWEEENEGFLFEYENNKLTGLRFESMQQI